MIGHWIDWGGADLERSDLRQWLVGKGFGFKGVSR